MGKAYPVIKLGYDIFEIFEIQQKDSLLKRLNLENAKRTHEWEGLYFGRIAEYNQEIEFNELVKDIENLLQVVRLNEEHYESNLL